MSITRVRRPATAARDPRDGKASGTRVMRAGTASTTRTLAPSAASSDLEDEEQDIDPPADEVAHDDVVHTGSNARTAAVTTAEPSGSRLHPRMVTLPATGRGGGAFPTPVA